MIVAFALMIQASALSPPTDWKALPVLPLLHRSEQRAPVADFVRDEVRSGRCAAATGDTLSLDLAILVTATGQVRRIVPRAIGCASVEQYAAGLVLSSTRDNLVAPSSDAWFRTTMSFSWG